VFVQLQNEIFMCGHLKYEGHRAFSFFLLPASVARMLRYELHCLCQTRDWLCLVCCNIFPLVGPGRVIGLQGTDTFHLTVCPATRCFGFTLEGRE